MSVDQVRAVAADWLSDWPVQVDLGLPEYDDRHRVWRVALLARNNGRDAIGEIQVAGDSVVSATGVDLVAERANTTGAHTRVRKSPPISFPPTPSMIVLGDARAVLAELPASAAQLVFTSPPYYNAKPECHEATGYAEYLDLLASVFTLCHAVLAEGRFLVVNTSPVLVRRAHRQASSRRLPIPFDLHRILDEIGFEFIDDIVWQKPEGAGWNLGRGRRFAADRQPLQYKPVTVTEYLFVYRKRTDRLIDWNIRRHPDQEAVQASLIANDYERTNVWRIPPAHCRAHPAVFPQALAERVVRYYSFVGDMVLDPFAGTGTTGRAATDLNRRFTLIDRSSDYFALMCADPMLRLAAPRIVEVDYYSSTLR